MPLVYVMQFSDRVKVGFTNDLKTRKISIQTELKQKVVRSFSVPSSKEAEAIVHKMLEPFRIQGEYYHCSFDIACAAVKKATGDIEVSTLDTSSDKIKFTLVLPSDIVNKLDYIKEYYGRSRVKEIEWACKEWIRAFEKEQGKITLEDLQALAEETGE